MGHHCRYGPRQLNEEVLQWMDIPATDEHQRFLNIEMQTSLPSSAPEFPSGERTDRVYSNSRRALGVVPCPSRTPWPAAVVR